LQWRWYATLSVTSHGLFPLECITDQTAARHGKCERGRDEKHEGARDIRRGEREIERGNINKGLEDIRNGQREERQGARRECRAGGRC
jgi:hypothetical protein